MRVKTSIKNKMANEKLKKEKKRLTKSTEKNRKYEWDTYATVLLLLKIVCKLCFITLLLSKVALKLPTVHWSGGGWALCAIGQN